MDARGRRREALVALVLLLPLLFINVGRGHSWGGDFAQYIGQAKCLAEGRPQTDTGYLFNENYPELAPSAYPVGFPILIAPVYLACGSSMIAFQSVISVFLILLSLLFFVLLRERLRFGYALWVALAFAYLPGMLRLKASVISDIPFSACFLLCVLGVRRLERRPLGHLLLLSLLLAFTLAIRGIGIVILMALWGSFLWGLRRPGKDQKGTLARISLLTVASLSVYVVLTRLLVPAPAQFAFFVDRYRSALGGALPQFFLNSAHHLRAWVESTLPLGLCGSPPTLLLTLIAGSMVALGALRAARSGPGVVEFLVAIYFVVIGLFPDRSQSFRYVLPVMPFLTAYAISGLHVLWKRGLPRLDGRWIAGCVASFLLLTTADALHRIGAQSPIRPGPYETTAQEAFTFLRERTGSDEVIVFRKPRVVAFFTDRRGFAVGPRDAGRLDEVFGEHGVGLLMLHRDLHHPMLESYVEREAPELIFQNEDIRIYRL